MSATSPIRRFIVLAFALSWGIGGIGLLINLLNSESNALSTSGPLYYLAGYAISLTGVGLTARYDGRAGLAGLGRRLIPDRASTLWFVVVALGYVAVTLFAFEAARLVQAAAVELPRWPLFLNALSLSAIRDPGPIGEEFGWRGFA